MFEIDFNSPIKVHFVGIGGISMSGLAEILADADFTVTGSDRAPSELTKGLEEKGIKVYYGQKEENIGEDTKLVVYTAAIKEDNPEYSRSKELGIEMLTRAELLGQIMKNYETPIAVSGTHGKTTTTSMLTQVLLNAQTDPTVSVGGMLKAIGGNIRIGHTGMFITEACEYTNSFLSFFPKISIILNIDEDHLDFFKDINDIRASFKKFADLLPEDGLLVINADIDDYEEITKDCKAKVLTVSVDKNADYTAKNISYNESGCGVFTAVDKEGNETSLKLSVPGKHNISNALSALAVAKFLNISDEIIKSGFCDFDGTDRRFQYKGKIGGVTIIDDYAHHPTEIMATLEAAQNHPHKKLWLAFQPHTYTRTKALYDDFVRVLSKADEVILADIYAAREKDTLGVSSKQLAEDINNNGTKANYFGSFDEIEKFILENCNDGDLLITMGAGDIVKVGENLLGR